MPFFPRIRAVVMPHRVDLEQARVPMAGIHAGEIVGWRAWFVHDYKPRLRSLSRNLLWKPRAVGCCHDADVGFARHILRHDPPAQPVPRNTCLHPHGTNGFWSFKSQELLHAGIPHHPALIFGTVWQWGEIIEHEDGYRSEYVAVRSIDRFEVVPLWYAYGDGTLGPPPLEIMRRIYNVGAHDEADQFFSPLDTI